MIIADGHFSYDEDVDTKTAILDEDKDTTTSAQLIVYNDDFNTFEWVITCFMEVLHHTSTQAEQLTYFVHYKGKASVKSGSQKGLLPFKDALIDRGLSAVIEY